MYSLCVLKEVSFLSTWVSVKQLGCTWYSGPWARNVIINMWFLPVVTDAHGWGLVIPWSVPELLLATAKELCRTERWDLCSHITWASCLLILCGTDGSVFRALRFRHWPDLDCFSRMTVSCALRSGSWPSLFLWFSLNYSATIGSTWQVSW